MNTSKLLVTFTALLALTASCSEERDWSKCNETVTTCRAGFVCDVAAARCVPITLGDAGDAGDAGVTDAPIATDGPTTGPTCTSSASCPANTPICGPGGKCVACVAAADCKDPARAFCVANACVGCQGAGPTACQAPTGTCNAQSGRCAECVDAAQCTADPAKAFCVANTCAGCMQAGPGACSGAKPVCDASSNRCVECSTGAECTADPAKSFCVANACVGCQAAGAGACKAPTPACATNGRCVECVTSADCSAPGKPICDTGTNTCVACTSDAQCAAKGGGPGVCMFHQDGRCASEAETIYVQRTTGCANGPAAGAGSAGAPFCTSQLGVDSVTPERRVIVLRGPDPLTGMVVGNAGGPISVFGQSNASVEPGAAGPGLRLTASEIYVRGVAIRRGSFEGVLVENGVLRMHRCRIENNAKGGVLVRGGGFDLANSIIVGNGPGETPGGAFWGGIAFTSNTASPARVANSTIVNNESAGIVCAAALQSPTGLIVFGNRNTPAQIGSTCAATVCCTGDPMLDANYRLTAGSPCIDKLPANMSTVDDIDGEPRPKGAASDCGADEF